MKALIYTCLSILIITSISCKNLDAPVANPPVVATWINVDSLSGLTNHQALDVYADSSGIAFLTQNGLTYWLKGAKQPTSYNFTYYSNPGHAFYKGCAYIVTDEHTITVIPYARSGEQPFRLSLNDFSLPPAQFSPYSADQTFIINPAGQMLLLLKAKQNAYEYLYTVPLDAYGHPIRNVESPTIGKQIPLPVNASFTDNYQGLYASNNQLYCTLLSKFLTGNQPAETLIQLQQITAGHTLQTTLPERSTLNIIPFHNTLYAFTGASDSSSNGSYAYTYRFYKSTDNGLTWSRGSGLQTGAYAHYNRAFSHFYTVMNRLIAINQDNYLITCDPDKDQVNYLNLAGLPERRGNITGLTEYEGYVYLTTSLGGVYRKPVNDVWQYTE